MKVKWVALVAALMLPTSAAADWQYTKWGMTPAEVITASDGVAVSDPEKDGHSTDMHASLLTAPYAAAGFEFDARFLFSRGSNLLSIVTLDLRDPTRCHDLMGALRSRYGEPTSEHLSEVTAIQAWRGEALPEAVVLLAIGLIGRGQLSSCSVDYQSRLNAGSGL
jgi:hypothetical protein